MSRSKLLITGNKVLHVVQLFIVAFYVVLPMHRLLIAVQALIMTLSILLIIPRLWKTPQLTRWHDYLVSIARLSKWMGLWTAAWFGLYALSLPSPLAPPVLFLLGLIGMIFMTLVCISNNWSYMHVRPWKQLNMTIWAVPSLLLGVLWTTHPELWWLQLLLWLCILSGFGSLWQRQRDAFVDYRFGLILGGLFLGSMAWLVWLL